VFKEVLGCCLYGATFALIHFPNNPIGTFSMVISNLGLHSAQIISLEDANLFFGRRLRKKDIRSNLAIIMAGGAGTRLEPATYIANRDGSRVSNENKRPKPAIPIAGISTFVMVPISNFWNARFRNFWLTTQSSFETMNRDVLSFFTNMQSRNHKPTFDDVIKPDPLTGVLTANPNGAFIGTAGGVLHHLTQPENQKFLQGIKTVSVFGSDHLYRMDPGQMLKEHLENNAAATISVIPVPVEEAGMLGILRTDEKGQVTGFIEKAAKTCPDGRIPDEFIFEVNGVKMVNASMGNYMFDKEAVVEAIAAVKSSGNAKPDFGHDVLPLMMRNHPPSGVKQKKPYGVYAYDFSQNQVPGENPAANRYWIDVGNDHDTFHRAHMDMLGEEPQYDLLNRRWPLLHTSGNFLAGGLEHVKGTIDNGWADDVEHFIKNSIVPKDILRHNQPRYSEPDMDEFRTEMRMAATTIEDSIVSYGLWPGQNTVIRQSVVMPNVTIGENVTLEKAVILPGVKIPSGIVIDKTFADQFRIPNPAEDGPKFAPGITATDSGVVIISPEFDFGYPKSLQPTLQFSGNPFNLAKAS